MGGSGKPEDEEFDEFITLRGILAPPDADDDAFHGRAPEPKEFSEWVDKTTSKIRSCGDEDHMGILRLLNSCATSNARTDDPTDTNGTEKFHHDVIELAQHIYSASNLIPYSVLAMELGRYLKVEDIERADGSTITRYEFPEGLSMSEQTQIARQIVALTCAQLLPVLEASIKEKAASVATPEEAKLFSEVRQRIAEIDKQQSVREGSTYETSTQDEFLILPNQPKVTDQTQIPSVVEMIHWANKCELPQAAQQLGQNSSPQEVAYVVTSNTKRDLMRYTSERSRAFDSETKSSLMKFVKSAFTKMGLKIFFDSSERARSSYDNPNKGKLNQNKPDYYLSIEQQSTLEEPPYTRPEARVAATLKCLLDVKEEAYLRSTEEASLPQGKLSKAGIETAKETSKRKSSGKPTQQL